MSNVAVTSSTSPGSATCPPIPGVEIDPTAIEFLTPAMVERLRLASILTRQLAERHGIGHGRLIATGFESYEEDDREVRLTYRVDAPEAQAFALWDELAEQMYQRSLSVPGPEDTQIGLAVQVDWLG